MGHYALIVCDVIWKLIFKRLSAGPHSDRMMAESVDYVCCYFIQPSSLLKANGFHS